MLPVISYYFTLVSPFTYLGHGEFLRIAKAYGAQIAYKPVFLGKIFPESGGVPLAQRHVSRQAYRFVELARWAHRRGLPLNLRPKYFPCDITLADRVAIALGDDIEAYMPAVLAGLWAQDLNLADEAVIAGILAKSGLDAPAIIATAKTQAIQDRYDTNNAEALALGVFGSPAYVLNGEIFWGQDRLDLLEDALKTGRAPFVAPSASPPAASQ